MLEISKINFILLSHANQQYSALFLLVCSIWRVHRNWEIIQNTLHFDKCASSTQCIPRDCVYMLCRRICRKCFGRSGKCANTLWVLSLLVFTDRFSSAINWPLHSAIVAAVYLHSLSQCSIFGSLKLTAKWCLLNGAPCYTGLHSYHIDLFYDPVHLPSPPPNLNLSVFRKEVHFSEVLKYRSKRRFW